MTDAGRGSTTGEVEFEKAGALGHHPPTYNLIVFGGSHILLSGYRIK